MSNTTFKKIGLILETSTDPATILLTEGETPIAQICLETKETLSRFLVMRLYEFLAAEKCSLSTIRFLAASQGPGSYTSLRIGGAVAKSLAYSLKIPLIGFCSLEIYTPPIEGNFLSAMDANTRGLYVLQGQKKETSISFLDKPTLVPHERANLLLEKTKVRLIPLGDPLAQKYPAISFIEQPPDLYHLANIVAQKMEKNSEPTPYPELDLLYL
jgi:tRNA threonylcarbamoyl adenosine modification protein YeaZ